MNYVTASVGYECGCAGGGEGKKTQYLHRRRDNWSPPRSHVNPPCVRVRGAAPSQPLGGMIAGQLHVTDCSRGKEAFSIVP